MNKYFIKQYQFLRGNIKMKIAVGLSGGVDSAVAAYLLKKAGHEVVGVTMKIWDDSMKGVIKGNACFGPEEKEDLVDIKKITSFLDIPFYEIDLSKEYSQNILEYFKEEYTAGRTPNPCVRCNQSMKFGLLIDKAKTVIDFDKFATGHYAVIKKDKKSGRYILKKGEDKTKDQSYFLSLLSQEQLGIAYFPLGHLKKRKVKKIAKKIGLFVHDKKESQDFYSGDYEDLLEKIPEKGNIVDKNGKVLGKHKGIVHYTIGQRKGLGIGHSSPLYVTGIDRENNTVIVGEDDELFKSEIIVNNPNWVSITPPEKPLKVKAKIRYLHKEATALITKLDDKRLKLVFEKPQRAIAPGQFAVFYHGKKVLGGGVIEKVN
jgi:tRNA-uridine 2-sulfurtransferase